MSRPWLALYPTDYLADTRDLSAEEHGVYCVLLMEAWLRGPLPDDLDRLRRMAAGAQSQSVRLVLERYWTRGPDGWTNARLERERARAEEQSQKQRRKAALRWDAAACATALPRDMPRHVPRDMPQGMPEPCPIDAPSQPQPHITTKTPPVSVKTSFDPPVDNLDIPAVNGVPYQAVVALYHEILVPPLARVFQLTQARRQQIAARCRDEFPDLEDWRHYFEAVKRTRLIAGFQRKDGTLWKPSIDWLVKQANVTKVAEGQYG